MSFLDKAGYQNPYLQLRSCLAKGKTRAEQVGVLADLFENAVAEQQRRGGTIRSHFATTKKPCMALCASFSCNAFRSYSRTTAPITVKGFLDIVAKLAEHRIEE